MTNNITQPRSKADTLAVFCAIKKWGNQCEICGSAVNDVHHLYPKGNFGHLRYNLNNLVPICRKCHEKTDAWILAEIMRVRGDEWYVDLKALAKERPISYIKVSWYKENIKILQDYLDD